MNEYKGIYYDANSDPKSYEGGAHFKYSELCLQLEELLKFLPKYRHGKSLYSNDENFKPKQSRNEKTLLQSLTFKLSEITKDKNEINYNKTVELVGNNKSTKKNQRQNSTSSNHYKSNILIQDGMQFIKSKLNNTQYQSNLSKPTRNKIHINFGKAGNNTKNESFSHCKVNVPYNNSSFYLNNNSNILIGKQNKRSLYHLIQHQKNNNKSISHTHEISSLSDLNSSAQDEVKVQGRNIIVQPKINISFVNNINTLGIPHDERSRNIKQGNSLMKMNTSIKKSNINLYCTNQNPSFGHQNSSLNDNTNKYFNTKNNKTPSPLKRAPYQNGLIKEAQSRDKPKILQTQGNSNIMKYFNISKKYSALQKRINQMKLKTRNDLEKISIDFENLITQKKFSNSLSKPNTQPKEKSSTQQHNTNVNNIKTQYTSNYIQPKSISIKKIMPSRPFIKNMVPISSSKSHIRNSLKQNNSFLIGKEKKIQPNR